MTGIDVSGILLTSINIDALVKEAEMKLWKNLRSPKIGRVEFCEPCGTVTTPSQRSERMREQVRDEVARSLGRF